MQLASHGGMITANLQLIANVLDSPSSQSIRALLEDSKTVWWVDAHQEETSIVQYCETKLNTGSLSSEIVEADSKGASAMYIRYNQKQLKVPLSGRAQDRHIILFSLNRILEPDYEIRFFTGSPEVDALAFIALPIETWTLIENRYGAFVQKLFYRILPEPNLFTDSIAVLN